MESTVWCPSCNSRFSAPRDHLASGITCPRCGGILHSRSSRKNSPKIHKAVWIAAGVGGALGLVVLVGILSEARKSSTREPAATAAPRSQPTADPPKASPAQPPRLPLRHSLRYLSKARRSPPFRQGRPCQCPILGEAKRHSMYHLRQSPCRRNRASHRALMRLSQTALLRVPSRRLRKRGESATAECRVVVAPRFWSPFRCATVEGSGARTASGCKAARTTSPPAEWDEPPGLSQEVRPGQGRRCLGAVGRGTTP